MSTEYCPSTPILYVIISSSSIGITLLSCFHHRPRGEESLPNTTLPPKPFKHTSHSPTQSNRLTNPHSPPQLIHSAVIFLTSATAAAPQHTLALSLLTAGTTMFSGSIYLLVLNPKTFKFLGPITPLGGLCLIGGWVALAAGGREGLGGRRKV